jgi:hypothetical protein
MMIQFGKILSSLNIIINDPKTILDLFWGSLKTQFPLKSQTLNYCIISLSLKMDSLLRNNFNQCFFGCEISHKCEIPKRLAKPLKEKRFIYIYNVIVHFPIVVQINCHLNQWLYLNVIYKKNQIAFLHHGLHTKLCY